MISSLVQDLSKEGLRSPQALSSTFSQKQNQEQTNQFFAENCKGLEREYEYDKRSSNP